MNKKMGNHNSKGFTLVEMLISAAILAIIIVSACGIYLSTVGSQKKVGRMINILQDAQFVMESMVKRIRSLEIDYSYTYNFDGDTGINGDEAELALKDMSNPLFHLYYRLNGTKLEQNNGSGWLPVTMSTIEINSLKFYINPVTDPFRHSSPGSKQPRVTIVITMKPLQGEDWLVLQQTIPQRFTQKK
ncbi:MAG: hypothetical protein Athens101410_456 [Parcubacteria group bacterium Athens1014_10]|nr:MAG: hypothetical protein Athens101410_456 [Parcubacteria group bacterium Athens1014_10]TSD05236.1 MAG: hypothetical protein Athens071412_434 [Parcubacteria group bacterium Athens0714_12]